MLPGRSWTYLARIDGMLVVDALADCIAFDDLVAHVDR